MAPDFRLTPKQKEVLDFIVEFGRENGYAPSQQEIANHFGFRSLGTVQNYLVRLERSGMLEKERNAKRSLKIAPPQHEPEGSLAVTLPLLGRVAAGRPIEAVEEGTHLEVPRSMVPAQGESFVLKVVGDSMIGDGILEGDFVIVNKRKTVNNGQTVVALLGNEATVKRYYRKGGRVELHAANPNYQPIIVESLVEDAFKIEGVVTGVLRQLG
jgi:repressor LexA